MTAPPTVFSPSNILPQPWSLCDFFSTRKNSVFFSSSNFSSLELRKLGSICIQTKFHSQIRHEHTVAWKLDISSYRFGTYSRSLLCIETWFKSALEEMNYLTPTVYKNLLQYNVFSYQCVQTITNSGTVWYFSPALTLQPMPWRSRPLGVMLNCSHFPYIAYHLQDNTLLQLLCTTLHCIPYILESNPHTFYSFRGLKNQMRIRIACGLDSPSWARFWKNDRTAVRALRTIQ